MRNNSIALFHLDGAPVLAFQITNAGPRIVVGEIGSPSGVDFYVNSESAERVKRAVEAFQAVMNEGKSNAKP